LTYPSEKYESVGMMKFPIYGTLWNNKIHVPNHQPDRILINSIGTSGDRKTPSPMISQLIYLEMET
jgi:hypothetical protein